MVQIDQDPVAIWDLIRKECNEKILLNLDHRDGYFRVYRSFTWFDLAGCGKVCMALGGVPSTGHFPIVMNQIHALWRKQMVGC